MGTHDYDIIIVGGGVAGSCAATALAPYGYRILLLERAVFPRDKPCGEGIMPQGIAVLDKLGVLSHLLAAGAVKFKGLRYRGLDGTWAQAEFPSLQDVPQYGLAMRRLQLDELLVNRARAFPNVAVREGFTVTGVILEGPAVAGIFGASSERNKVESFRAPLTVAADGRDSIFPNKCGLTKRFLRRKRFGITGHLEGMRGLGSWVEVLLHEDGEIYIAPCGSDTALVALLVEKRSVSFFKGDLPARYMEFLRSFPGLEDRLAGTQLLPPVFAVGPLGFRVSPCYHPGLLLIGDSGGFLDPITGQGMTLALKQVEAAVPVISRAFQSGDFSARSLSGYAAARARLTKDLFLLTRLLLRFSRPRVLAGRAVRRLALDVALFQKLLAIASGARPYRDLSVGEKLSLLIG